MFKRGKGLKLRSQFCGKEDAMMTLGTPNTVVTEPAHARQQRAISIDVHVGNEEFSF